MSREEEALHHNGFLCHVMEGGSQEGDEALDIVAS